MSELEELKEEISYQYAHCQDPELDKVWETLERLRKLIEQIEERR